MSNEADLETVNRRLALLEEDAKGEKLVSRHVRRKVTDVENRVANVEKELSELRAEIVTLRADLPDIIAATVGPLLREALAKK